MLLILRTNITDMYFPITEQRDWKIRGILGNFDIPTKILSIENKS